MSAFTPFSSAPPPRVRLDLDDGVGNPAVLPFGPGDMLSELHPEYRGQCGVSRPTELQKEMCRNEHLAQWLKENIDQINAGPQRLDDVDAEYGREWWRTVYLVVGAVALVVATVRI